MKTTMRQATLRYATYLAIAIGAAAALPAVAGPMDSVDPLVQKARPMAFGDFAARKQLCAILGVDGNCMDEAVTLKDGLLQPIRDPIADTAPAMVQPTVTQVPEPSILAVLAAALGVLMLGRTRRRSE